MESKPQASTILRAVKTCAVKPLNPQPSLPQERYEERLKDVVKLRFEIRSCKAQLCNVSGLLLNKV